MGFFDDLNSPVGSLVAGAEEIGFSNPDPGLYRFELTGVTPKAGNKKDPNAQALIFNFALTDGPTQEEGQTKSYGEYLVVPQPADPRNPTADEKRQASYLKARIVSLGIPEERISSFDLDELEGVSGTLSIAVTSSNGRDYVNIRDLKLTAKVAPASPVKPVAKRAAPAQRKVAPVAQAPVEAEPLAADEGGPVMDHAPEEQAPKAKPASVVGNPFARG